MKGALEEDFDGHRNRAALRDQINRLMEIDVVSLGQPGRVAHGVSGALQLLASPFDDPVELGIRCKPSFCRSHI
jgi:hypothetical protein